MTRAGNGDPPRPIADVRGSSAIAASVAIMNVSTYAFTIVAARLLGPQPFGAFVAVMNVLLVAAVIALALQATAARRIAREPGDVGEVEATILTVGRRAAIGLGLVFVALSPLVSAALRLDSIPTALLMALAVVPTTLMGAQAGVLQGERRWMPLSLVYLSAGVPRLVLGVLFLWWRPEEIVAIAAVAAGAFVPVLVASIALRKPRAERSASRTKPDDDHSAGALWRETLRHSMALLAFLILSSADIIMARNTLDAHSAGLYAAGLIMVKAVTFLPQFVVVLAFPSMGTDESRRSALVASLGLVALTGVSVIVGVTVLPDLALIFVGGAEYQGISDQLWVFALLGTVLSMIQLLVYSGMARQDRFPVVLTWIAILPLAVAGLTSGSMTELLVRVLVVDSVLLVALLSVTFWRLRHDVRTPAPLLA